MNVTILIGNGYKYLNVFFVGLHSKLLFVKIYICGFHLQKVHLNKSISIEFMYSRLNSEIFKFFYPVNSTVSSISL